MEQFCRTCGTKIATENCLKLFSGEGRPLLQTLRFITNCWVENVAQFPSYICQKCQTLLKQIQSFRRRCAKIEKYLTKHRTKLEPIPMQAEDDIATPQLVAADADPDPLGIDELMSSNSRIKEEHPEEIELSEVTEEHYLEDQELDDEVYEERLDELNQHEDDDYMPLDDAYEEMQTELVAQAISKPEPVSPTAQPKPKTKTKSNKHTMRLGRKLIHVKVIDDKEQPKRIMDRDGQTIKPCICEHCGRQFRDSSNLNVHLLRHTGTKPYECQQCHQKCYTLHLLRRHQLKHTEGPYTCTFCGLEYSTNSSRVRHEREACKKGRAPQSKWELIKKGERTFHCEVCDLWFLRAGNFTQHINSSSHMENERRKTRKSKTIKTTA